MATRARADQERWTIGEDQDADGFTVFYREEYPQAVRLAWLLTRSASDAEDLAQDAFVAVEDRFSELEQPRAYLRAALVHRCRRWQKRRDVGVGRMARFAVLEGASAAAGPADEMLLEVVAGLPYRQRMVLVARYWAGWSEAEIAAALGCRPGTVKSLAARGLERVRIQITDQDQEGRS